MSRARPLRPSQVHRRTGPGGTQGKHKAVLVSTVEPWPLPPAPPARAWSPVIQYRAFSSASTARRSTVLKRVFMARLEGLYRSFLHRRPDSTLLLLCAGALGGSTAAQKTQYSLKRTAFRHFCAAFGCQVRRQLPFRCAKTIRNRSKLFSWNFIPSWKAYGLGRLLCSLAFRDSSQPPQWPLRVKTIYKKRTGRISPGGTLRTGATTPFPDVHSVEI